MLMSESALSELRTESPASRAESTDAALALVQRTSLTRLVADAVENLILTGELPPGSKLNEATLADSFGVSRGPMREAFRMLEEWGLIRQEKNRGANVREIDLDEAAGIYDLRAGLDATAGRLLVPRITVEQVQVLRTLTDEMQTLSEAEGVDRFHALNLAFHDRIVELAGNKTLTDVYGRLVKQLALFRRRNLLAPRAIPRFADEHSTIVDCLAAGDAIASAEALYQHAQGGKARMLEQRLA
jgi:phosphonate utilization transcriptional regulator